MSDKLDAALQRIAAKNAPIQEKLTADRLAAKQASLDTASRLKNTTLQTSISVWDVEDGDNIFYNRAENVDPVTNKQLPGRFASPNGYSVDAYEHPLGKDNTWLNSVGTNGKQNNLIKMASQRLALAKELNVSPDQVTNEMVFEKGVQNRKTVIDALTKGQDVSGQHPGVSEEYKVDITEQGKGFYGRPLIGVTNPVTGEDIVDSINTPESNAAYDSFFNAQKRADDFGRSTSISGQTNLAGNDGSEIVQDIALSAAKGGLGIGETAYALTDIASKILFSPINAAAGTNIGLDDALRSVGLNPDFDDARQILSHMMSDEAQASEASANKQNEEEAAASAKRIQELKDSGEYNKYTDGIAEWFKQAGVGIEALVDNPVYAMNKIVEFIPQLVSQGAIGSIATKFAVNKAIKKGGTDAQKRFLQTEAGGKLVDKMATRAGITSTAAFEASGNYLSSKQEVLNTDFDVLAADSDLYKSYIADGLSKEAARIKTANRTGELAAGMTAMFAAGASKITGAGKASGKLFTPKTGADVVKSKVKGVVANTAKEGAEEGIQGGTGEFSSNVAKKALVDPDQDLLEGTARATGEGLALGAAAGGGVYTATQLPRGTSVAVQKTVQGTSAAIDKVAKAAANTKQGKKYTANKAKAEAPIKSVIDNKDENFNIATAVQRIASEYNKKTDNLSDKFDVVKSAQEMAITTRASRDAYLSVHAKDEGLNEDSHLKKLNSEHAQAEDIYQKVFADYSIRRAAELTAKDADTSNLSTTDTEAIATLATAGGVVYGSEPMDQFSKLEKDENIPQNIRDLIGQSRQINTAFNDYLKSHAGKKTAEEVKSEIFGKKAASTGKSFSQHVGEISTAIQSNDQDAFTGHMKGLNKFITSQANKVAAYEAAIKKGVGTVFSWGALDKKGNLIEHKVVPGSKNFLENTLKKELDIYEKQAALSEASAEARFKSVKATPTPKPTNATPKEKEASVDTPTKPKEQSTDTEHSTLKKQYKEIKTISDVVAFVQDNSTNNVEKAVLKRILPLLRLNTEVVNASDIPPEVGDIIDGNFVAYMEARIDKQGDNIANNRLIFKGDNLFFATKNKAVETFLHEMVHDAAQTAIFRVHNDLKGITDAQRKAVNRLEVIRSALLDVGFNTDAYSMSNINEMVAYALTDANFQQLLKDTEIDINREPVNAWNAFTKTIMNLLGLGVSEKSVSAFSDMLEATEALLQSQEKLAKEKTTPPVIEEPPQLTEEPPASISLDESIVGETSSSEGGTPEVSDVPNVKEVVGPSNPELTWEELEKQFLDTQIEDEDVNTNHKDEKKTSLRKAMENLKKEVLAYSKSTTSKEDQARAKTIVTAITVAQREVDTTDTNKNPYSFFKSTIRDANNLLEGSRKLPTKEINRVTKSEPFSASTKKLRELANQPYASADIRKERDQIIDTLLKAYGIKDYEEYVFNTINGFYTKHNAFPSVARSVIENAKLTYKAAELFTSKRGDGSILGRIPDLFTGIKLSPILMKFVKQKYKLTPTEIEQLTHFQDFVQEFKKVEAATVLAPKNKYNGYSDAERTDDPLHNLRDAEGNLPENLVAATALVSLNILTTRTNDFLYRDAVGINKILNHQEGDPLPEGAWGLLGNAGFLQKALAAEIGPQVRKQINIGEHPDTDGLIEPGLDTAIGLMAINVMEDFGFLDYVGIRNSEIDKLQTKKKNKSKKPNAYTNFVSIPEIKKNDKRYLEAAGPTAKIIAEFKDHAPLFDKLFRIISYETYPLSKPASDVRSDIKKTLTNVSPEMEKGFKQSQDTKFTIKTKMVNLVRKMSKETILTMRGYVFDMDSVHITEEETVEGQNQSIEDEYNKGVKALAGKSEKDAFHFLHTVWVNVRNGFATNMLNPQTSKLARFLIGADEWNKTLDMNNPVHHDKLKIAIVEALQIAPEGQKGLAADKSSFEDIYERFDTEIMSPDGVVNPVFVKALKVIKKLDTLKDGEQLSTPDQKILIEATSVGGEKMHSLDGLIALADYAEAVQSKGKIKKITVSLTREVDATTDGLVSGTMQIAPGKTMHNILRPGGVAFKGDPQEGSNYKFSDYINSPGVFDNYEQYVIAVANNIGLNFNSPSNIAIKGLLGDLVRSTISDGVHTITGVPKEGRDFGKDPVMHTAYGESAEGIADGFVAQSMRPVYGQLMDARTDPDELFRVLKAFDTAIENNATDKQIRDFAAERINTPNGVKNWQFPKEDENKFKNAVEGMYKTEMIKSLDETLGEFASHRNYINSAIFVQSQVYAAYFNNAVKAYIKDNNGNFPTVAARRQMEMDLRDQGLLPGGAHPTSTGFSDYVQVTKYTDYSFEGDGEKGRVKQKYNRRIKRSTIVLDENLHAVAGEPTDTGSTSEHIAIKVPMDDPGAKGFVLLIHATDGNIIANMYQKYAMYGLHDAIITDLLGVDAAAKDMNGVWANQHMKYSVFDAIQERMPAFNAAFNNLPYADKRAIQNNIGRQLTSRLGVSPEELAESYYQPLAMFNTRFDGIAKTVAANRKYLAENITAVSHSPTDEATYVVGEEKEVTIKEGVDQLFEETLGTDNIPELKVKRGETEITGEGIQHGWEIYTSPTNKRKFGVRSTDSRDNGRILIPAKHSSKAAALQEMTKFIGQSEGAAAFNTHIEHALNDVGRGRGSDGAHKTGFTKYYDHALNAQTAELYFTDLGKYDAKRDRKKDSPEHTSYLQDFLSKVLTPVLAGLDEFTLYVGESDTHTRGWQVKQEVYVASAKGTIEMNTELSAQEVYVHELIHAVWTKTIDSNPVVRRELKRLFYQAEKSLDYTAFLKKDSNGKPIATEAEIAAAKDRYAYVFEDSTSYIHEFATFGLTNEVFMEALATVDNKTERDIYTGSFVKRLYNLFMMGVDALFNRKKEGINANIRDALRDLAGDINSINAGSKAKLDQYWESTQKYNTPAKEALVNKIVRPYIKQVIKNTHAFEAGERGKVRGTLEYIAGLPFHIMLKEHREVVDNFMYNMGQTMDNPVYKMLNEIAGANKVTQPYHTMLRHLKHTIDSAVDRMAKQTTSHVASYFDQDKKRKISDEDWEHMTAALLKTDLSSVMKVFKISEIEDFMRDQRAVNSEIDRRITQIRKDYKQHASYYIFQAENLGGFMATGKHGTRGQAMLNAYNIARGLNTGLKPPADVQAAKADIDVLATLYAIKRTDKLSRSVTADYINHEYTYNDDGNGVNGVSYLLGTYERFKENSLRELFNGNETSMVKGYTHELYDDTRSFKVGPASMKEIYKEEGYEQMEKIKQDDAALYKRDMYIYVSKDGLLNKWVSGILSLQSKQRKGTTIAEIMYNDPSVSNVGLSASAEFKKIDKEAAKEVQKQIKGTAKLDYSQNYYSPVVSPVTGNVVDYRYTMSEKNKKKYLNKKDPAHKVMGRMVASVRNKTESAKGNIDFFELAKNDFDQNFHKNPRGWVEVSPDALDKNGKPDNKLRELYRLLPEQAKIDSWKIWGKDESGKPKPIIIREDLIDLIFGFRKASFTSWLDHKFKKKDTRGKYIAGSGLPNFMTHSMRQAGAIWTAIVGKAKRNIVIFIPMVLQQNALSNEFLLLVNGVAPWESIKYQREALRELTTYQLDMQKKMKMEEFMRNFPSHPKTARYAILVDRLEQNMKKNPVSDLIDEGLFQSIVEDVEFTEEDLERSIANAIPSRIKGGVEYLGEKIPEVAKEGYKQITLAADTELGNIMMKATQYSDFVARYALYKHTMEKGSKEVRGSEPLKALHDKTINLVVDTFINYDIPTSAQLQWMNDMGVLMFTKFLFRIQRVIVRLLRDMPLNTIAFEMAQQILGDLPDITDSNLLTNTWLSRLSLPGDTGILSEAFNLNILYPFGHLPGVDTAEGLSEVLL